MSGIPAAVPPKDARRFAACTRLQTPLAYGLYNLEPVQFAHRHGYPFGRSH